MSWSRCYGSGRTAIRSPYSAAQRFADHINSVLNRTVTDARLSLVALPREWNSFELTRFVGGRSAPLALHGCSLRLFVRQIIKVLHGHCHTESYAYRVQADDSIASWLLRWEYLRDPPRPDYAYPAAHVHVNGAWQRSEALDRLHIPTRRLPLELVVWHLISEWGVTPKTGDWQMILRQSIEGFDERQTTR